MIRVGEWKYTANKDYIIKHALLNGKKVKNLRWLHISDGLAIVPRGYSCNGNSPKWAAEILGDWYLIGTPDGPYNKNGDPITARAFFWHDAFYQYGKETGMGRKIGDMVYRDILLADGVKKWRASAYYAAVRVFGDRFFCDGS